MYLKSLEMQGFKSFPDKTRLVFEDEINVDLTESASHGVTVIVGPNGSGKSNIADAMRWVLGEISSKTLRGTRMEDVIFGGADSRRPMGYAEVSVTFDNRGEFGKLDCPYDEVVVTRRYFRSGDSEYFINRKGVRLKDIYELFMNTGIGREGYSIIGQGRIDEMVSRKSEERRGVFEDASGIAKYRHKKDEAERRLEETHDNLTRVNDIFAEIQAQVGPLEKDAEKARKGLEAYEKKKEADVTLWLYDTDNIRKKIETAKIDFQHALFDLSQLEETQQQLDTQYTKLFEEKSGANREAARLLDEFQAKNQELSGMSTSFALADQRIESANAVIENLQSTLNQDREAQAKAQKNAENYAEEKQKHVDDLRNIENQQTSLSQEDDDLESSVNTMQEKLDTALHDIEELSLKASNVELRLSSLEGSYNANDEQNASTLSRAEEFGKISEVLQKDIDDHAATRDGYAEQLKVADADLAKKNAEIQDFEALCASKQSDRDAAAQTATNLEQRYLTSKSIAEQLDGYSGAVRHVMKLYDEGRITSVSGMPVGTIYGPLSHLISVEETYVTAMGVALGANMQNIVVDTEETAKACMYALKKDQAGRATFFPLTSMKPATVTPEMNEASRFAGYVGIADTLIKTDARFKPVVSSLLGRTVVFDTIDHAIAMARATHFRVRTVTLDGQQINAGGSFTGGSSTQGKNLLSQASELLRLEEELKKQNARVKSLAETCEKMITELKGMTDERDEIQNRRDLIQSLVDGEQKEIDALTIKLDANNQLVEQVKADLETFQKEKESYESRVAELEDERRQLNEKKDAASELRTELADKLGEAKNRRSDIERNLVSLQTSIEIKNKEIENAEALRLNAEEILAEANARLQQTEERIEAQRQIIRDTEDSKLHFDDNISAINKEIENLRQARTNSLQQADDFEKRLNAIQAKQKDKMADHENLARIRDKAENHLNDLYDKQDKLSNVLLENYQLTSADAVALNYPPVTEETYDAVVEVQKTMRARLNGIGNFDPNAIEKYNEVKGRFDYYDKQLKDLSASEKELNDIIATLESDMKTAFVVAFNQINENFGKVFADLFGGGHAELYLSDPDNVLESGIEIKAAPPGKIIKNLLQLSGGERAFIGVALFFAILQVNPTPFCILDEIESALDEVNVERLAQYIRRYTAGTQFIMITHRRGTMAAAERLYGVSMPEQGISKVMMLDVSQISKEKGETWNGLLE